MKTNEDVSPCTFVYLEALSWLSTIQAGSVKFLNFAELIIFVNFHSLSNNGISFLCGGFDGHFVFWDKQTTNKEETVISIDFLVLQLRR